MMSIYHPLTPKKQSDIIILGNQWRGTPRSFTTGCFFYAKKHEKEVRKWQKKWKNWNN